MYIRYDWKLPIYLFNAIIFGKWACIYIASNIRRADLKGKTALKQAAHDRLDIPVPRETKRVGDKSWGENPIGTIHPTVRNCPCKIFASNTYFYNAGPSARMC